MSTAPVTIKIDVDTSRFNMVDEEEQLRLIGCGCVVISSHGRKWECVLPLCDGEHHLMTLHSWEYH